MLILKMGRNGRRTVKTPHLAMVVDGVCGLQKEHLWQAHLKMMVDTESYISSTCKLLLAKFRRICAVLLWSMTTATQTEICNPIVLFVGAILGEVCQRVFWTSSVAKNVDMGGWMEARTVVT